MAKAKFQGLRRFGKISVRSRDRTGGLQSRY
jgi:hypothetical protein